MQADGNGSGAFMHSGMRGGPHVGALRRCSFTETESYSERNPRASPESPPAGSLPTGPDGDPVSVRSASAARVSRDAPSTKLIPSRISRIGAAGCSGRCAGNGRTSRSRQRRPAHRLGAWKPITVPVSEVSVPHLIVRPGNMRHRGHLGDPRVGHRPEVSRCASRPQVIRVIRAIRGSCPVAFFTTDHGYVVCQQKGFRSLTLG